MNCRSDPGIVLAMLLLPATTDFWPDLEVSRLVSTNLLSEKGGSLGDGIGSQRNAGRGP